jgi:hypothetical protein
MLSALYLLASVLGPASLAGVVASSRYKARLFITIVIAGVFFLFLVSFINDSIPFATGGDDRSYFDASIRDFDNAEDWFDLTQFEGTHEQGGYPLMMSWVHQFSGGSLIHRKALNVALFLLTVQVWFSIGNIIAGQRYGFACAMAVMAATPLWFYFAFLLKDMTIVFLQSLFLLGAVRVIRAQSPFDGYVIVALSTLAVLPFRSALAFLNVAILGLSVLLRPGSRLLSMGGIRAYILAGAVIGSILFVGTQEDLLDKLGVRGPGRMLDAESVEFGIEMRERVSLDLRQNPVRFVLVYLVGEVAAFNPSSWSGDQSQLLRGATVIPWVYIGLPLFVMGAMAIVRKGSKITSSHRNVVAPVRTMTIDRRYFMMLLAFVGAYAVVSWLTGDTTRWRMPSFPPMLAIAAFAWVSKGSSKCWTALVLWGAVLTAFVVGYYTIVK